jgi:hypothetical protein
VSEFLIKQCVISFIVDRKKYIIAHFWHVYVNQNFTCTFSVLFVSLSVCLSRCYGYENIEKKILKPGQIGIFTSGSRDYYVPMNLKGN